LKAKEYFLIEFALLLDFAIVGFLRFNELAQIRASHLKFSDSHLKILIESSKTDIYRQGHNISEVIRSFFLTGFDNIRTLPSRIIFINCSEKIEVKRLRSCSHFIP
jgi:hypothetical protein